MQHLTVAVEAESEDEARQIALDDPENQEIVSEDFEPFHEYEHDSTEPVALVQGKPRVGVGQEGVE